MKKGRTSIALNLLMACGGAYCAVSLAGGGHVYSGIGFGLMALTYVGRAVRDLCIIRRAKIGTIIGALKMSATLDVIAWGAIWLGAFAVAAWQGLKGDGHMAILAALTGLAVTPLAGFMIYGSRLILRKTAASTSSGEA